mgnify:CR=1 FL=1
MAKHDEIAKIYDQKLSQLRDPAEWKNTLRLTSNFWRLDFCAAMLLVVQNPQAQMCGTLAQWNNVGRYVRRGSKGIALIEEMTNTLHRLDSTRPVTCGVNIFFNFLYSMGFARPLNSRHPLYDLIKIVFCFDADSEK